MLRSGLYNVLSAVVRLSVGLLTVPLLIRIVGLETYGLWSLVSAVVAVVALAEAGLAITTTVFVARDLADQDRVGLAQTLTITIGGMALVATSIAVALWFGAPQVERLASLSLPQQREAVAALRIGALIVWTRLLQQVLVGVQQAYNRYGTLNLLVTAQAVLGSVGIVLVAHLGGGLAMMMLWQALVGAVVLVAHGFVAGRLLAARSLRLVWSWPRARALGRYSGLTWLSSLGGALFSQCDRLIVGATLGIGPLAIYAAVTSVVSQINALSALPVQPLLPHLGARARGAADAELRPQLHQSLVVNAVVAFALGGGMLMLATPLLELLLAREVGAELLPTLWAAVLIYTLYSLNATGYFVLLGLRSARVCTTNVLLCGALALALIATGARAGGLLGAALGNAGYLGTLYLTWRALHDLQVSPAVWLRWLAFPLGWFGAVCALALVAPEAPEWRAGLLLAALAILAAWFIGSQRLSLEPLMRSLVARQK